MEQEILGTPTAEIITNHFMVEQQDIRLEEQAQENPALFFRRMWLYLQNAIPRFNRPPEAKQWLKLETIPTFDDFYYTADTDYPDGTSINTGKLEFQLCSTGINSVNRLGKPIYTPISNTYDPTTGTVTITEPLNIGTEVQFDFYTDGKFVETLDGEMGQILGLCVQIIWERRFDSDFLLRTAKIKDKSFALNNEANLTRANTERLKALNVQLDELLKKYEQNIAYRNVVSTTRNLKNV